MAGKVLNISLNATITPLQKALENVGKMMNDFAASIEKTDKKMADSIKASVAEMNSSLEKVKQSFVNTEKAGDNAGKKGTASLRQQLRMATAEAQRLAEEVGTTDPKFIAAAKRAAELKDSIGDTALAIDAMNPDEKFKGVANLMGGIMGVAAGIQGAMTAFGIESDDAQKAVAKLQGLMAMSQGLNQLGGLKDAMGAVKTQVIAASQSMGTFKTALVATGIGAAVVLIGLLAANWDKVTDAIGGTSDKTRAYKMAQEEVTKSVGDAQAKFYEAQNAIDLYKKGLISKEQALKVYNETAGEMIGKTNNILEADRNLENNVSVYLKMMEHKTRAQVLFAKAAEQSAKISTGEAAEVGFWQTIGNAVLAGTESYFTFGMAGDFAGKQVASSQKNVADAQSTVNKLTKVANEDMKEALKLEKQLGDVKAKNTAFDAAQKPKAKKTQKDNTGSEELRMFKSLYDKQKEYTYQEQLLREESGMTSLEIDKRYAEISEKYKLSDSIKILDIIRNQYREEKKEQENFQNEKAKLFQEATQQSINDYTTREELAKKKGMSIAQIDLQFEKLRLENAKLTNEQIYALIDKANKDMADSMQLTNDATQALNQALRSAATEGISEFANAMGQAFAGNLDGAAGFMMKLVDIVVSTASALGKTFIGMGLASYEVQTSIFKGPAGALKAVAAGAALIAASALARQIVSNMGAKKMEQGGIVYGNSFVNVGEYGNAHTNPEVIAPLSKLRDLIGNNGTQKVVVEGRIYGSQISLASNRNQAVIKRVNGRR